LALKIVVLYSVYLSEKIGYWHYIIIVQNYLRSSAFILFHLRLILYCCTSLEWELL